MRAKLIIEKNILTLQQTLHKQDKVSLCFLHNLLGKVIMAVELGTMTWEDAEKYIDIIFSIENNLTP